MSNTPDEDFLRPKWTHREGRRIPTAKETYEQWVKEGFEPDSSEIVTHLATLNGYQQIASIHDLPDNSFHYRSFVLPDADGSLYMIRFAFNEDGEKFYFLKKNLSPQEMYDGVSEEHYVSPQALEIMYAAKGRQKNVENAGEDVRRWFGGHIGHQK